MSAKIDIARPLLVSEREAGRLLGVCPKTIFNLRARGELPAVKIGAAVRYRLTDIERFVERRARVRDETAAAG